VIRQGSTLAPSGQICAALCPTSETAVDVAANLMIGSHLSYGIVLHRHRGEYGGSYKKELGNGSAGRSTVTGRASNRSQGNSSHQSP